MKKISRLVLIACITHFSVLHVAFSQEVDGYSNISSNPSPQNFSGDSLPPYEVILNDLADTPWGAVKKIVTPFGCENRTNFGASLFRRQVVAPFSISLKKGKDLVVHVPHSWDSAANQGMSAEATCSDPIDIIDWNGWDNALFQWSPLDLKDHFVTYNKLNESTVNYYFKNNHSGKVRLRFLYCISGNDGYKTSYFNSQEVIVTIK